MGMGNVPSVPSLALGSGEVTLMAMTSAYAAFADQGLLRPATFIRRVEDADGKVLFDAKHGAGAGHLSADRVPDDEHALRRRQLRHGVQGAAGRIHASRRPGRRARRTITSMRGSSASRRISSTGVWVGFDKPRTIISNGFAGELAVPMWARFMKQATANDKPDTFKAPQGLMAVERVPAVRAAAERGVRSRHHGILRARHRADADLPGAQLLHRFGSARRRVSGRRGRCSQQCGSSLTPPVRAHGRRRRRRWRRRHRRTSSTASRAEEQPKKKRGFWGRVFGRGDKDKATTRPKRETNDFRSSSDRIVLCA